MGKTLTITLMGNKGDKLHESSCAIVKQNLKFDNLAQFIEKHLVGRAVKLDNKIWIFWELFQCRKAETLNIKKLDKIIRDYFK